MTERTLPSGTITFLFSDIERSTQIVQQVGPLAFAGALERHNQLLRGAFAAHGGTERGTQGDSFLAMFDEAPQAVEAAAEIQRALAAETWPQDAPVRVRIGLHTGVGMLGGDDYVGVDVHRAARIAGAAHGGQVLVSEATHALTVGSMPKGTSLRRLGEYKLRDLAHPEQISQLVIDGLPSEFPPITGAGVTGAGNLPGRGAPLIGRDDVLRQLDALVDAGRLITLTGPGGIGKTSLALEVAHRRAAAYAHGAWFVPLDELTDASLVPAAIAASLELVESPGQSAVDRLRSYLRERSLLLVLDNLEHVLPAATLVNQLLEAARGLTILATSRAPLRLTVEQEYPVPPLTSPEVGAAFGEAEANPAVRLFVERARRARPDYALSADEAPAVAEICRRLDGLPLGIQLAASRISLLPARTIASRLAGQLRLPGAASRDVPARQQTVEKAIAWSEELLDESARALLARLAVFRGGFRLEEAEVVALAPERGSDLLEGLSVLVDQSLVLPIPGPDGPRYRLLEPIRTYAARRLAERGEHDATERRHALAYLDLAEAAAAHLPGGGQRAWLDRLGAEHDNLRAAVTWAIEHGDTQVALRLGVALWRFWQLRGNVEEGRAAMQRIMDLPGADEPTSLRARALAAAGGLRYWSADVPGADLLYREQLEVAESTHDTAGTADAMFNLGHTRWLLNLDNEEADRLAEGAERLYRELGDETAFARVAWTRINRRLQQGRPGVEDEMREALRRFEQLGDDWYIALANGTLAWMAMGQGNLDDGIRWGLASINGSHAMGDVASPTIGLHAVAIAFHGAGMPEEAATIDAAFDALCSRYGVQPPAAFEDLTAGLERMQLDLEAYPDAAVRGASMSLDETVDFIVRAAADLTSRRG